MRAVFESQAAFSPSSNVGKRLRAALDFVDNSFDDETVRLLRNRTVVQSLLTFGCCLLQSGNISEQGGRIAKFFAGFLKELNKQVELGKSATDRDCLEFQATVNANIKDGVQIRQQILLRKFLAHDPEFVDLLGPTAIANSGIKRGILTVAGQIVMLVGQLNEKHSAQHGKDLWVANC